MFVGEGAGRWEMERGGPFAGKAGTMFGQCLNVGSILRSDHVVTNAIKCRCVQWQPCPFCDEGGLLLPDNKWALCPECNGKGERERLNPRTGDYYNAKPDWKQVQECGRRYLDIEMQKFDGDLIVPMGDVPLYATTAMRGITKLRGSVLEGRICRYCGEEELAHQLAQCSFGFTPHRVMPVYHPAYLLRNSAAEPITHKDFKRIPAVSAGGYEKQEHTEIKGYRRVLTDDEFDTWVSELDGPPAMDLETSGLDAENGYITVFGAAEAEGKAVCLTEKQAKAYFSTQPTIIGQNFYDFDIWWLLIHKLVTIDKLPTIIDTLLLGHAANPDTPNDLVTLVGEFAQRPLQAFWKSRQQYAEDEELVCMRDCDGTWRAKEGLVERLEDTGQWEMVEKDVLPLIPIAIKMRWKGIRIDKDKMTGAAVELDKMVEAEKDNFPFDNFNSHVQVKAWLYGEMGVRRRYDYKKGTITTGKPALTEIMEDPKTPDDVIPVLQKLIEVKQWNKLSSTFMKQRLDAGSRVHGHVNLAGARTGRFSYHDPNLQQIPPNAKDIFIADPGHIFIEFDFRQIEFLILLYFAGEWELLEKGLAGYDFHSMVASIFFGVPYESIDKHGPQRRRAKTINFGVVFGSGAYSLSIREGLPFEEVEEAYGKFLGGIPGVVRWRKEAVRDVRRRGFIETPFQWRRYLRPHGKFEETGIPRLRFSGDRRGPGEKTSGPAEHRKIAGVGGDLAAPTRPG